MMARRLRLNERWGLLKRVRGCVVLSQVLRSAGSVVQSCAGMTYQYTLHKQPSENLVSSQRRPSGNICQVLSRWCRAHRSWLAPPWRGTGREGQNGEHGAVRSDFRRVK